MLEPEEKAVQSWQGNYETETKVAVRSGFRTHTKDVKDREGGVLVLTSRRLIWLEAKGMFGKSYHASLEIPLENVKGTSMGGTLSKFVTIADDNGSYLFHLKGVGDKEFPEFRKMMAAQMTERKTALESQRNRNGSM